ncbi:MAG TPA: flavin monoamine oxidase family protein [Rhizomicrobium sp.]|jgi:monoamine oxidase
MGSRVHTIVIGAGFSGLKAAMDLAQAGKSVLVLEARDRVGGRVEPGELCGRVIDHGGQWVGPKHTRLLDLARRFQRETYLQYAEGRTILSLDGKRSEFKGETPKMPVLALVELAMLQSRWAKEMKTLPKGAPWTAKNAKEWDSQTLATWIKKNLSTKASRAFAGLVPKGAYAANPMEVSYLWMLEMLRSSEGLDHLMAVKGGVTDSKFKGGMHQITRLMGDALGDRITLSAPVREVMQDGDGVRVTTDKGVFEADHVIIAVPPSLCDGIHFAGGLPAGRSALQQRQPHGGMIKIHVAYKEPFWRHNGYSGQIASNDLPLGIVMDDVQDVGPPMLIGFVEGRQALELSALGDNERRARIMDCMADLFGPEANDAIGYAEKDWLADEWARGYVGAMGPGVLTTYGEALRAPVGRIHWASTETAEHWTGHIEGAILAGERAAAEVLSRG